MSHLHSSSIVYTLPKPSVKTAAAVKALYRSFARPPNRKFLPRDKRFQSRPASSGVRVEHARPTRLVLAYARLVSERQTYVVQAFQKAVTTKLVHPEGRA